MEYVVRKSFNTVNRRFYAGNTVTKIDVGDAFESMKKQGFIASEETINPDYVPHQPMRAPRSAGYTPKRWR